MNQGTGYGIAKAIAQRDCRVAVPSIDAGDLNDGDEFLDLVFSTDTGSQKYLRLGK